VCGELLISRGRKKRVLWWSEEEKITLKIRRLHCEDCNKYHHELPDCIVPYKRYCADIIENIAVGQAQNIPCSENTVRRIRGWWEAVKPYFLHILLTLIEKMGASFGNPPAFREILRAVSNSNNWIFAHQICTRSELRRE